MSSKNNKFMKESDKSHVRMYKTGHGWVAALTRLLKFLSFKGGLLKLRPRVLNKTQML